MEPHVSINRACEACKRKKTKCDGKKPSCSLCVRIRNSCHYPQRKSKTRSNRDRNSSIGSGSVADDASTLGMPAADPAADPASLLLDKAWKDFSDLDMEIDCSPDTGSDASSRFSRPGSDTLRRESFSSVEAPPPPCRDSVTVADDASGHWGAYPDNYYFAEGPPVFEQSPTDQDMLEYLAQTLPDIWTPDPLTQTIVPRPLISDDQTSIIVSAKAPADFIHDHVPTPELTDTEMQQVDLIDPSLSPQTNVFGVPAEVVDELIELYFRRTHVWAPLFHRPTFAKNYLREGTKDKYANLKEDSIFIIYGMMALSARFSSSSHLIHLSPDQRGKQFARKAQIMYQEVVHQQKPFTRTFAFLQGLILLAFYNQACRPVMGCDLTVATCTKFAWDLNLHAVDDNGYDSSESVEDWVSKEAQRRAWWAIWELDTFEAIASRRPFTIDRSRCHVMLPVSDDAWFSNTPVRSAEVSPDILHCWKTLKDCPNQDEKAWFLVANIIMAHAMGLCQQSRVPAKTISDIDTVISCFSLLYHENFRIQINGLIFDEDNYAKSNWILFSRVMIKSSKIAISILEDRSLEDRASAQAAMPTLFMEPSAKMNVGVLNDPTPRQSPKPTPAANPGAGAKGLHQYRQPAADLFRVFQTWSPDYIGFAPPTMACLIIGPRAILLRFARHMREEQNGGNTAEPSIQEDLLVLILRHFAHYWNIGIFLLDFVRAFREG